MAYINQLSQANQNKIIAKAKAFYENELNQPFTDDEKEIILNSKVSDIKF